MLFIHVGENFFLKHSEKCVGFVVKFISANNTPVMDKSL